MSNEGEAEGDLRELTEISFHYLKTSDFRNIHVDGVFGGVAPTGLIHASVFCERAPLPRIVTHKIVEARLGDEIGRTGKTGMVRDLEANLVLTEVAARVLHSWLGDKLADLDRLKRLSVPPTVE